MSVKKAIRNLDVTISLMNNKTCVDLPDDSGPEERDFVRHWLATAKKQGKEERKISPWPHFSFGDIVEIKGFSFSVIRINMSSVVLQPLPARGYSNPRKLIKLMT